MSQDGKKIDFSKGRHKDMLIWQRRQMWTDETVERYVKWMDLTPGMTAIDIGCGLGYLGYTYWKYFGEGGHYLGTDIRIKLLKDAKEASGSWAVDGNAGFITGDVYDLPFPDCSADWVMCQTLMIHLEKPEPALSEMIRVLKPGGLILCLEPDNLRPTLVIPYCSLPDFDLETQLLIHKVNLIVSRGKIKLGRGDNGIAPRIPHMLYTLGICDIDIRIKETVSFLEPPYTAGDQQERIDNLKKYWLSEENFKARTEEQKEEFLAGGGDPEEFNRLSEIGVRRRILQLEQINNNKFSICGAYPFYIIKGRKPEL